MKLATYLSHHGIGMTAFARLIGAANARTVQRYTKHGRVPSGRMMAKIVEATDGAVQPGDFLAEAE